MFYMIKYFNPVLMVSLMNFGPAQAADPITGAIGIVIITDIIQQYISPHLIQPPQPVVSSPPEPTTIKNPCYWVKEPLYDRLGNILSYRQVKICSTH